MLCTSAGSVSSEECIQPEKIIKASLNNIKTQNNNYYYTYAEFFFPRNVFIRKILKFMDILIQLMGQRDVTINNSS